MSETVLPETPVAVAPTPVAAPAAPAAAPAALDLGKFAAPSSATANPSLRKMLLTIGVQTGLLLLRSGKTPEELAQTIGLDIEEIYSLMTGRKSKVDLHALVGIAEALEGVLQVQLIHADALAQPRAAG